MTAATSSSAIEPPGGCPATHGAASGPADEPETGRLPWLALLAVTAIGAALRIRGIAELPWGHEEACAAPAFVTRWFGATPFAARLLPATIGIVSVPVAALLLARRFGKMPAVTVALLLATSPWHVHASRLAALDSTLFAMGLVGCVSGFGGVGGTAGRWLGRLILAATLLAALGVWRAELAPRAVDATVLLFGDLGVGVALLFVIAMVRRLDRWAPRIAVAWLLTLLLLDGARGGLQSTTVALVMALVLLGAGFELARWMAATASRRVQLALLLMAIVPGLPGLMSEQLDGGRFDVRALLPALERARRGSEPLYASVPELATRELHVAAQPLTEVMSGRVVLPPRDGVAFVLLLLERGRLVGGEALPPGFEARFSLLARSSARRFDLRRFEARLYRSGAAP